jgi:type III pantothenate kinase
VTTTDGRRPRPPLLLAIDVGNTNTVFALFAGRELQSQWRISTVRERTGDEYAAILLQLMGLKGFAAEHVGAVVMATVVPQAVFPLRRMSRDFFGCDGRVVGEDLDYGIEVRVDNPAEVGADRLVNAVAAHTRYRGTPLIVLDFGTATTFDVVDGDGAYRGGVISPGINLSLEALHRAAAKLPRVAVARPQAVIGRNTVAAMQSGIFWGYIGLIEGTVARIRAEFERPMATVATGGLAHLFGDATAAIERVDPDLTMAGLVEIYHRHNPSLD